MSGYQTGLQAYLEQNEANRRASTEQLQQVGFLQKLAAGAEARNREQAYRQEIASAATPEERAAVAAKFSGPDAVLKSQQDALNRQAQREATAAQYAMVLQQRNDALEERKRQFDTTQASEAAKRQFEEWYKTEQLKNDQLFKGLNLQFQQMGLELKKQGNALQLQRFDREQRDKLDKSVTAFANELQQNKVPGLASSITSANDLLKKYEDGSIPGLGVFEGSKHIPEFLRGPEANNVRSSLQAVTNDLLNLYSGLAVTLPEAERRELEQMQGGKFTDIDFKNAWPRIVNRYNSVIGNLRAGQKEEVLREYQGRPGAMKLDPLTPAFVGTPEFASEADAAKAAAEGKIKPGDKIKVGGKSGTWK